MLRAASAVKICASLAFLWAGILLLGGCAADRFTESDDGQTRTVTQGDTFFVSLASSGKTPAASPRVEGSAVQFVNLTSEPGRDLFRFYAEGAGEADIRIRPSSAEGGGLQDFVLRVKVERHTGGTSSSALQQKPSPY